VRPLLGAGDQLVMTIDVVTPMSNDPETFGAVAAANALSDVYAMGGEPRVALGFIGFPTGELPLEVLEAVLAGMTSACREATCAIVGGHTIIDPEPKAGLAVTGTVPGGRAWTHRGARAGQALVLTKPIGTGIVINALKKDAAPEASVNEAMAQMRTLNRAARDLGLEAGATAATDVTGFGLLGHLRHMTEASGLTARVDAAAVPLLGGARELAQAGQIPGGSKKNLRYVEPVTCFAESVPEDLRLLLADAQTSGGLLLAVAADAAAGLARRLVDAGMRAATIGELVDRDASGMTLIVE
jgi:selenide,water dikinase